MRFSGFFTFLFLRKYLILGIWRVIHPIKMLFTDDYMHKNMAASGSPTNMLQQEVKSKPSQACAWGVTPYHEYYATIRHVVCQVYLLAVC